MTDNCPTNMQKHRVHARCFFLFRVLRSARMKIRKVEFSVSVNRYERMNQQRLPQAKKRVAAYCRVSTNHEEQASSFESQQRYFRQYIQGHADWELYEIFADEGLSGTTIKNRKAFQKMIACARRGEIDLIITKEISRFARNTLDSIAYTRELKKLGVGVIFTGDNLNTLDADAELRLTILSSIAQEESRKTSERVKWGQKRRMEQGVVFGRSMLGYDVKDGKMTVNPEGAAVVRLIFHKFVAEGKSTRVIARELLEAGIRPMRSREWSATVILRLLRNEKYCGDLVQKKTYTPDYLSHDKKYNKGQESFVIIRNHHAPIISRALYERANQILDDRAASRCRTSGHSGRYPFSGKIKCGFCGASFVARCKVRKDGSRCKTWRCYEAQKHRKPQEDAAGNSARCAAPGIRNEDAVRVMSLLMKTLPIDREKITEGLLNVIAPVVCRDAPGTDTQGKMQAIGDAVKALLSGTEAEDEFYGQLLDRMVIEDSNHICVYLNSLPFAWQFTTRAHL